MTQYKINNMINFKDTETCLHIANSLTEVLKHLRKFFNQREMVLFEVKVQELYNFYKSKLRDKLDPENIPKYLIDNLDRSLKNFKNVKEKTLLEFNNSLSEEQKQIFISILTKLKLDIFCQEFI